MTMFEQWMIDRLQRPLPGVEAHERFVPDIPDRRSRLTPAPDTAKKSAVLIPLLYDERQALNVLLTVRSEGLRNHRGQISFPGGRSEEGEDATTTALREAHEEIGLTSERARILGPLTPLYIPPSNSAVTPIVAVISPPQQWMMSTDEVSEIIIQPISTLLEPTSLRYRNDIMVGRSVDVPYWDVHPTTPLWGATAMMLHELITVIHEFEMEHA